VWTDDVRDRALELIRVDGIAAAHRGTGVPKSTLTRWAATAGVNIDAVTQRHRRAGQARGVQLTTDTVARLERIITAASAGLIRLLEANADAAEVDEADLGEWSEELGRFTPPEGTAAAAAIRRYAHIAGGESTRDLSAALSRAVHDLALIRGEPATDPDVIVHFGIPRPVLPTNVLRNVVVER